MNKGIILIAIGILLLAIDLRIPVGENYPAMIEAEDLGEVLQGKVINNFIGAKPKLDVISDLLGYVIIFIGALILVKKSKKMIFALILIPFAIYLYINIPLLAYNFEARDLYLKAAGYNYLIVVVEILIEFFVIHGIVSITDCIQNKWHNNELLIGWIAAMFSKGILVGINFFYGYNILFYAYSIILIALTVFYLTRLFKTLKITPEVKA